MDEVAQGFEKLPTPTQILSGKINYAVGAGVADAYTLSLDKVTAYTDGMEVVWKVPAANTGASTIDVNSLGARSVRRSDGSALSAGDLAANKIVTMRFNATVSMFEIQNSVPNLTTEAVAARDAAIVARDAAQASASAASTSEANAAGSASSAETAKTGAESAAALSQAWADSEGAEPGGAGTKSAKEWAAVSAVSASSVATALSKADINSPCIEKTGAGTAQIKAGTSVLLDSGVLITFAVDTAITMPTMVAGTDYAVWVKPDGAAEATDSHTSPPVADSRKIGGFNYAPGGLATGTSGGDSTPQIIAGSIWDLKFRPACHDPRGMKLVADTFWVDLWNLNTDPEVNGTSKAGATIADGSSPPKVPTVFGGDGTATYANGNWWNLAECLKAFGKRYPTYDEFAALAYGVTEATSRGTDPVTCQLDVARTSQHCFQATGNMWIWGAEFGGGNAAASWTANTGGRGSTYQMENAALFGGGWGNAAASGSRCSSWGNSPTFSADIFGARGVCDHLILE
jgi:hypothetical protein